MTRTGSARAIQFFLTIAASFITAYQIFAGHYRSAPDIESYLRSNPDFFSFAFLVSVFPLVAIAELIMILLSIGIFVLPLFLVCLLILKNTMANQQDTWKCLSLPSVALGILALILPPAGLLPSKIGLVDFFLFPPSLSLLRWCGAFVIVLGLMYFVPFNRTFANRYTNPQSSGI